MTDPLIRIEGLYKVFGTRPDTVMKMVKDGVPKDDILVQTAHTVGLKNINLEIPKGKTVALVGQSGSGKTTFVDLLPRFYDVIKGGIFVDGEDIRDLKIADMRNLMGNVNQESILDRKSVV